MPYKLCSFYIYYLVVCWQQCGNAFPSCFLSNFWWLVFACTFLCQNFNHCFCLHCIVWESSASKSSGSIAAPVYSKINKKRPAPDTESASKQKPPVAPRRVHPLARIEHDFSPALSSLHLSGELRGGAEYLGSSDSDSSSSDDGTLRRSAPVSKQVYDEFDDEVEDTYTCMDGLTVEFAHLSAPINAPEEEEDEEDRYTLSPLKPSPDLETNASDAQSSRQHSEQTLGISSLPLPPLPTDDRPATPASQVPSPCPTTCHTPPRKTAPRSPTPPPQLLPHSSSNSHKPASPPELMAEANRLYENSTTVRKEGKAIAKPAAAPRRVGTVSANIMASAPIPPRRVSMMPAPAHDNEEEDEDNYENSLGEFGMGVSSVSSSRQAVTSAAGRDTVTKAPGSPHNRLASVASRPNTKRTVHVDNSKVPLPVIPGTDSSRRPQSLPITSPNQPPSVYQGSIPHATMQSSVPSALSAQTDINIPLADRESSDSSAASLSTSLSPPPPPARLDESSLPRRYVATISLD